ncbi:MAG: SGNH/GDSL hydrolase family protein [Planctomycetes bacterium]|nr:SGNH/GDSL hydrolase family protein [Planctomycetota bacterium]
MPQLTRRSFLAAAAAVAVPPMRSSPRGQTWVDVADWPIDGRAFADRKAPYDRLPARAEGTVRKEVWELSRNSAGMVLRLQTTSPSLHVRYRLTSDRIAMPHMPATGVSGVDLYGHDGKCWRWLQVSRPSAQDVTAELFRGAITTTARQFLLYLPLYNGVSQLELGVADGHDVAPLPPRPPERKPIVAYGTSILHGACASRPGMAWSAIVGRELDREVVNLGFSGNGRLEPEVGLFLAELDPAVFVIDCLPNVTPQQVAERTVPLVRQLRTTRPQTPILLVEDRTFGNAWFHQKQQDLHQQRRQALRDAVAALQKDGVPGLHLLGGKELLGEDDDGTTDGSHPNDLGMHRQAQCVIGALRPLLDA